MSIADLRNALDDIAAHPEDHDQSVWICGTTACLAGRIVLRAGWQPVTKDPDYGDDAAYRVTKGDDIDFVPDVATRIIGLRAQEGAVLWDARNTLDDLHAQVMRLEADQSIYTRMSLPDDAYEHAWTDRHEQTILAAHRRTTYWRKGGCIEQKDWPTRAEALDYVLDLSIGRLLTRHDNPLPLIGA